MKLFKELEQQIEKSYTEGVTIDEAEKLAAKVLHAQILIARELRDADLDARMRKSGVKAVRAAVYMDEVSKSDKKPTEAMLTAILDSTDLVQKEQDGFDKSETDRDELERQYDILTNAHIYFRNIGRGKFE